MKTLIRSLPLVALACWTAAAVLAQQPGPATLEGLVISGEAQETTAAAEAGSTDAGPKRPAGTVARPKDGVQHPDLDKAWADYDAAVAKVTDSIKAAINKQFDAAVAKGDLDAAEKWQAALGKFEKTGELPTEKETKATLSTSIGEYKQAREELTNAYEAVVKALTMDKKIADAKAVRREAAGFISPKPLADSEAEENARVSSDSGSGDAKTDRLAKPRRILVIAEPKTEQETAVRASQKYKMRLDGTKSFADVINRLEQYDVVVCCSNSMDYWGDNEDRKKPAAFEPVDRFIARGGHCVIFGAWNGRNMQHLGRYGIRTGFQHTSFFKPVAGVTDVFLAGAEDLVPADKRLQSTGNFTCEAPHTVLLDRDDGRGPAMITLSRGKGRLTFSQVEPMWPEDKNSLWIIGATLSWVARGSPIK